MRIRPARPSDSQAIAELHAASWRSAYRELSAKSISPAISWRTGMRFGRPGSRSLRPISMSCWRRATARWQVSRAPFPAKIASGDLCWTTCMSGRMHIAKGSARPCSTKWPPGVRSWPDRRDCICGCCRTTRPRKISTRITGREMPEPMCGMRREEPRCRGSDLRGPQTDCLCCLENSAC